MPDEFIIDSVISVLIFRRRAVTTKNVLQLNSITVNTTYFIGRTGILCPGFPESPKRTFAIDCPVMPSSTLPVRDVNVCHDR